MDISFLEKVIKISRPLFWIYLAGPFLLGYTAGAGDLKDFYSFGFLYSLAYFLVPANIFLYGVNDIADKDTDRYNLKKTYKENKYRFNQLNLYLVSIFISIILSIPLFLFGNTLSNLILITFFALGFFYSVPPIRFKARPILDFLSNCLYAFPGIYGYALKTNHLPDFIYILAAFSWCFAMHLFSAIPDIKPDTKAKLCTSAVKFGEKNSLILCSLFWLLTASIVLYQKNAFFPLIIYPIIPIYILVRKLDVSKVYWKFPYLNLFIGFYLFFVTVHLKNLNLFSK